jgi:hypothetical protein
MEVQNRKPTNLQVQDALKKQGRKKVWLAGELKISRVTLDAKLKDNTFTVGEILKLKHLFGLK